MVQFTSNHGPLLAEVDRAFPLAVEDTRLDAQKRAKKVTGRWANSIQSRVDVASGEARIGSDLVSAKAHEKGAYIQARNAEWLAIPMADGSMRKVKAVRIPAQPAVTPAGKAFPEHMTRRLREAHA